MNKQVKFTTSPPMVITYDASLTEEERSLYFVTERDYRENVKDRKQTVRALRRVRGDERRLDPSKYCSRGLEEYQSIRFCQQLKAHRTCVVRTVLEEQKRQKVLGIRDEETMRRSISCISIWAAERSLDMGSMDQEEAWGIQSNPRQQAQQQQQPKITLPQRSQHHPQPKDEMKELARNYGGRMSLSPSSSSSSRSRSGGSTPFATMA